ncbi:MAG: hypothetical protein HZA14_07890 [Nitrospirae bacterium]|nr:hypothetical protein [Nitrospirota bacterium]
MIDKAWEILTTLTDEAQNTARAKCQELGFDPNRGIISLDESFINLISAKLILADAIEKQKLIQLPITVQKTILNDLQSISKFLTGLTNGADEVANLVNAIEKLNTTIWQYGLHNLSEEVLGYQTKLNQLKNQELEIIKLKDEVEDGLTIKRKIEKLLEYSDKATQTIQPLTTTSDINVAFYIKLSLSLPIIYAITFCTVQYSRERKLEEEYAFKSNISISLIPYQELVSKLVGNDTPTEKEKYTAFIIESISKVFTSPTEKVFEDEGRQKGITDKAIKQITQLLEPVVKALKH